MRSLVALAVRRQACFSSSLTPHSSRGHGFTLIELLVVLVIIGVLAAAVSLAIGSRSTDDRMQAEAHRLQQLIRFAADEAQAKGLEVGLRHTEAGFEFLGLESGGRWSVYQDSSLRPRPIPQPFYLEMRVEGRLIPPAPVAETELADEEKEEKKKEDEEESELEITPQILLLSSGEMTPFVLDLKLKNHPAWYRVQGDALGRLSLERQEDKKS